MAQQTGAIYHQGILYSGGSGTNVTPNPQGEATDTLNTVEIDDTIYDIEGGGGSNLIIDAQRYSLDEQVVGIWTDGKPLYQKTFYTADLNYSTVKTNINVGSISGIDMVVSLTGILSNAAKTARYQVPFPTPSSGNLTNLNYNYTDNCIYFSSTTTWADSELYATILYTKTTDTAGSGGYQAYGFSPIIYSDIERKIGVWSDNKPLYKKTFFLDLTVTDNAWTHYLLGTTGIDIKDVEGYFSLSSIGNKIPFSYYRNSNEYFTWYTERNNEDIAVRPNMNAGTSVIVKYVTIIYTKNSDIAGSGEYNALAIPNVHYSTDEQVIGTWIDGKPLYRKVLEFTGGNTITAGNVDSVVLNEDTSLLNVKRWIKTTCVTYDYGSSITTDVFGTLSIKSIHGTQAQIYNAKITDNILLPSTGNYIIAEYTKTTD